MLKRFGFRVLCASFLLFFGRKGKRKMVLFLGWVKEIRVVGIRALLICCTLRRNNTVVRSTLYNF